MTVLLGFYLGHDSNIAVSINGKIKYRKSERYFQKKHHKANLQFVFDTLNDWGIDKVDYCAYTDGNRQNLGICQKDEFFCDGSLKEFKSYCLDHHYAHALSLWPVIDTEKINYSVSIDGRGDWNRSMMVIKNPARNPTIVKSQDSLGMGYEFYLMGKMLGFTGMEYDFAGKLMGLQSYSEDDIVRFGLPKLKNTSYKTSLLYGDNNAYSTYKEWHEYWWNYVKNVFDFPKDSIISYTGGCAQNSVYNYRLKKMFENIHIPPHAYDGGLSLGCLEFLRIKYDLNQFENTDFPFWQDDSIDEQPTLKTIKYAAECISRGKIIGWMQGSGELGPRSLGNRSILMNAINPKNKDILNDRVKKREMWRPYAGSILSDFATQYFDMDKSEYMLYACNVTNGNIPAVTHVDNTCRMQTVKGGIFAELIYQYYKLTGIPLVLNTSLNVMGKPIKSKIENPIKLLQQCNLDYLFVGNKIYHQLKL